MEQKQQYHRCHQQHQQQLNKKRSNNKYISANTDPILTKLEIITTRLSLKCSAWKGFLARLEVAEKFVVVG